MFRIFALVLAVVIGGAVVAAPSAHAAEAPRLEVFVKPGCTFCDRAKVWVVELAARRPDVTIVLHDISADATARARLFALAEAANTVPAVPAFVVGDRVLVGFDDASTTGATVEAWLAQRDVRADTIDLPWLGGVRIADLGIPAFTVLVGLVDGFNPCAMWVLLLLLSFLVNVKSRRRMALIGGTFVAVSGVVYYVFMAAWLGVFMVVGMSRGLQIALGLIAFAIGLLHVKEAAASHRGPSLAIPEAAKPRIYARIRRILRAEHLPAAIAATVGLAVMVNLVELLCTAGLPAMYTQILTAQGLPTWQYYGYLALYIAAYMFDDALMVTIAVVTLSKRKLQERGGKILQLVSGAVMIALGVLLLVRPEWLSFQ